MHVTINNKLSRFQYDIDGRISKIPFLIKYDTIALFKTEVPIELKGKGIAVMLVVFALNYAKENHLKILVYCPYIKSYIEKNPEWKSLLKEFRLTNFLFLLQYYFSRSVGGLCGLSG